MIWTLFSGLVAGVAHVVSGPDHIAAIAPLAVHKPRAAAALGFRWGIGHGLGAMLFGLVGIVAGSALPMEAIAGWAEWTVGFCLIGVGLWGLHKTRTLVIHTHTHDHDEGPHDHVHVHVQDAAHVSHGGHAHSSLALGFLQGAAGTGHLLAVVPSLALPTHLALTYLIAYFVSAVVCMTLTGSLMGLLTRNRRPGWVRLTMAGAASLAIVVGLVWTIQLAPVA